MDYQITWPEPKPVFFRLYHDAAGRPLFYSMEDVPGTYIEITQEEYSRNSMNVRVLDGCLLEVRWQTTDKLVPSNTGTPCHPSNVAIVVETEPNVKWSKQTYEAY
jgi:hypothetical protein